MPSANSKVARPSRAASGQRTGPSGRLLGPAGGPRRFV